MKKFFFLFLYSLLAPLFPFTAYAAPGSLDAGFGSNGLVVTNIGTTLDPAGPPTDDSVVAIGLQPDGKIVAAIDSSIGDFTVVRYNPNGSLDSSFGGDGIVTTNIGLTDVATSLALQSDGKIVVAGYSGLGIDSSFAIVRYQSDGSLDSIFGGDGIVTYNPGGNADRLQAIALQSNGTIFVTGCINLSGTCDFVIIKYASDGSPVTAFGADGIVVRDITPFSHDFANAIALTDTSVIVAGFSLRGFAIDFVVIKHYSTDGSVNTSFGNDGFIIQDIGTVDIASAVAIQPSDGKIVVAGSRTIGPGSDFAVLRYNFIGSLDTDFDSDGIVVTPVNPGLDESASGMVLQPDGKILVAGYGSNGENHDFVIVRYNSDGSLDTGFNSSGIVVTDTGPGFDDYGFAMALQPDGKIVVGGKRNNSSGSNDLLLVRYDGDTDSSSTSTTSGTSTTGTTTDGTASTGTTGATTSTTGITDSSTETTTGTTTTGSSTGGTTDPSTGSTTGTTTESTASTGTTGGTTTGSGTETTTGTITGTTTGSINPDPEGGEGDNKKKGSPATGGCGLILP